MIDFSITNDQKAMLDAVDHYLQTKLPLSEIRRRDFDHVTPYDILPDLGQLGVLGLVAPEKWNGLNQDWLTLSLIQEGAAQHAYFVGSIINRVVGFGLMTLLNNGTHAQQSIWIPKLIRGEGVMSLALTEPSAGSDAGALITRASPQGDGWCINGRKTWISDADGALALLVPARTDPESKGHRGISMFIVPRNTPGIAMTRLPKIGNNAMPSWDISFDDVWVSRDSLLGELHQGFKVLGSTLHYSRASLAATCTGCAQSIIDMTIAHIKERHQFGHPLADFQVVRHRIADMQMRVDQSRLTVRHLAWLISTQQDCRREASQAKVIATETLQDLASQSMQLFASYGYSTESDIQRIWRDSRLYTFGEGANEVHRDLIAKQLGL